MLYHLFLLLNDVENWNSFAIDDTKKKTTKSGAGQECIS